MHRALYAAFDAFPSRKGAGVHIERFAGFNSMDELRPHRGRHRFVPFSRPLDDQLGRAVAAA